MGLIFLSRSGRRKPTQKLSSNLHTDSCTHTHTHTHMHNMHIHTYTHVHYMHTHVVMMVMVMVIIMIVMVMMMMKIVIIVVIINRVCTFTPQFTFFLGRHHGHVPHGSSHWHYMCFFSVLPSKCLALAYDTHLLVCHRRNMTPCFFY